MLHVDQSNKSVKFIDFGDHPTKIFPPFYREPECPITSLQEDAGKRQARSWVLLSAEYS